jgi:hypothetical protein
MVERYSFEKSLEIKIQCVSNSHVSVADTMYNMSIIYDNLGDTAKGLELTRNALRVFHTRGQPRLPAHRWCLDWSGSEWRNIVHTPIRPMR